MEIRKINYKANPETQNDAKRMAEYILKLLKGENGITASKGRFMMTEKYRQFCTWGTNKMFYICATDGSVGLQMKVSGLKHRGRVRIWYNYVTDYFDVEFLKARKDEAVCVLDDIDFEGLHNVCHWHIERTDDPCV